MIRAHPSRSAHDAKAYFTGSLARDDYYAEGGTVHGHWLGKGAELLGLPERVTRETFAALAENRHPSLPDRATGEEEEQPSLTPRTKDARTVAWDISFHPPKSVSVMHALTQDKAIETAMVTAVRTTMADMEAEMLTRVRREGQDGDRLVSNLVWAEFLHTTSRPVSNKHPADPQLHIHCFTFNAVFDPEEARWKAGQFREVRRDMPYWSALFHSRLAEGLLNAGYDLAGTGEKWELAGVPESVIDCFSKRTKQIEAIAHAKGITDPKAKAALGAKTRKVKDKNLSDEGLRRAWDHQLTDDERQAIKDAKPGSRNRSKGTFLGPARTAKESLDYATDKLFERQSVVQTRRLLAAAIERGVGQIHPDAIRMAAKDDRFISRTIKGIGLTTTREVLAEEEQMLAFARSSKGTCRPLRAPQRTIDPAVGTPGPITLSPEQRRAVDHVLTSGDRVMVLRGQAGTGKTTTLNALRCELAVEGQTLHAFAPTAEASRGVLRDAGFHAAETLATLLSSSKVQDKVRGGVVLIDEAGQVGMRDMNRLFKLAASHNLRLLLSGDTRQHHAVDRGDPLRALETEAGLVPAHVTEIRRQRGELKKAVAALSRGDVAKGFAMLDEQECIRNIPDAEQRLAGIADEYVAGIKAGKSVLVVAPAHVEGQSVTETIRGRLKDEGQLQGEDVNYRQLRDLGWTKAQRQDAGEYTPGMVAQFSNHVRGFKRGEQWEVQRVDRQAGMVEVAHADGRIQKLPLERADRFGVMEVRELALAAGDRVRITRNGQAYAQADDERNGDPKRLTNGHLYTVKRIAPGGDVILDNNWRVDRGFGHLTHGYCQTSYAVQGKDAQRVIIAQSSESWGASSAEQFYVSCSRAKDQLSIFTDDRQALLAAVTREAARTSATELSRDGAIGMPRHWSTPERTKEQQQLLTRHADRRWRLGGRRSVLGRTHPNLAPAPSTGSGSKGRRPVIDRGEIERERDRER